MAGFICIREPNFCHVVFIRKRGDPGNENERLCVAAIHLIPKWPLIYADTNWPLLPRSR